MRGELDSDQFRLFEMIWKRTIASQMSDARGRRITIAVEGGEAVFQVSGKTIDFPGFLRAYVEGSDDPQAELADKEILLPKVERGQSVGCSGLEGKGHATQPPPRYSEAALTQALEEMGIGRPSTYASIIDTIQAREYVFKKGTALVPSWTAFSVVRLLEQHLGQPRGLRIHGADGGLSGRHQPARSPAPGLSAGVFSRQGPAGAEAIGAGQDQRSQCAGDEPVLAGPAGFGEHTDEVFVRVGKFGPFLEQGDRRASIPQNTPPDELTLARLLEMLNQGQREDEPLGQCPQTGKPVYLKTGRFGPYVQLGAADDEEKKNASLPKGMAVEDVDVETALKLLALPRTLGPHPDSGLPVVAHSGRYGPFVKCGEETRSLPDDLTPLEVSLEQALVLLAQPKTGRGRRARPPKNRSRPSRSRPSPAKT